MISRRRSSGKPLLWEGRAQTAAAFEVANDGPAACFYALMADGVPVLNVPTRVIYPEGGLSHFDVWRDNLRISWMHTRLTTRMLLTFPAILYRRWRGPATNTEGAHWSRLGERGSALGLRTLIAIYRGLGDPAARLLLRAIVFWHWLFGQRARQASRAYLARLHAFSGGRTPRPTAANAYRHLLAFANSALDKVAGWRGRIAYTDLDFPGRAQLETLQAQGRGAILLGAHLGNLEMLRALALSHAQVTINAVVYTAHAQRFTETLAASSERFRLNLLHVPAFGPDTAILLREKVERGEFLVIVGDRTPPAENGRVVHADFLGAPALFPQGPYVLAALLGVRAWWRWEPWRRSRSPSSRGASATGGRSTPTSPPSRCCPPSAPSSCAPSTKTRAAGPR